MPRGSRRVVLAAVALFSVLAGARAAGATDAPDPIAAELGHWTAFVREHPATGEIWAELKPSMEPLLTRAEEALRAGRRWLALLRVDAAQQELAAVAYLDERSPAERKDLALFEAEWKRMASVLGDDLAAPAPERFAGVHPALVRGLAEAAAAQVRVYYDASLEYGRSTEPESGLYYLGAARSRSQFVSFCRSLSQPSRRPDRPPRALGAELDELESELLREYRPPASIERHAEFIAASAALKTARELDAAGLRYGALLRYLQAAQRIAPLRAGVPPPPAGLARRLLELEAHLARTPGDHSIGRLFLELGQADLAAPAAAAIATEVLPRYLATLEPARPRAAGPEPGVTVTLVRWPYT